MKLTKALCFAAEKHKYQRRKFDDSPYINHLLEVVQLLTCVAEISDINVLQAAALHDILEDTETNETELKEHFDSDVIQFVKALTDDKSLPLDERHQVLLAHISELPYEVKLIKLADLTSNIATVPSHWEQARKQEYVSRCEAFSRLCFEVSDALADEFLFRLNRVRF